MESESNGMLPKSTCAVRLFVQFGRDLPLLPRVRHKCYYAFHKAGSISEILQTCGSAQPWVMIVLSCSILFFSWTRQEGTICQNNDK